jgi:hypothetical protein
MTQPLDRINDFFATKALYEKTYAEDFFGHELHPDAATRQLDPSKFMTYCENELCKDFRVFSKVAASSDPAILRRAPDISTPSSFPASDMTLDGAYLAFTFKCSFCESKLRSWVEVGTDSENPNRAWYQKVGQAPSASVHMPTELSKALAEDAKTYRKGLTCLGHGYGIAACAYFRRVFENQLNALLDALAEINELDNGSKDDRAKIEDARSFEPGEAKIKRVDSLLPQTVRIPGDNTLLALYKGLSHGIHAAPEDEALRIAQTASKSLKHITINLSREQEKRKSNKGLADEVSIMRGHLS